ncbi:hypothetical protein H4Q26_011450 [Puccinia striiformis f. sp. tritici PST-130]|nr:hypothetical protein H4Q26_011450 [Puccinia striiformis f. sp. tritici PST-130]
MQRTPVPTHKVFSALAQEKDGPKAIRLAGISLGTLASCRVSQTPKGIEEEAKRQHQRELMVRAGYKSGDESEDEESSTSTSSQSDEPRKRTRDDAELASTSDSPVAKSRKLPSTSEGEEGTSDEQKLVRPRPRYPIGPLQLRSSDEE